MFEIFKNLVTNLGKLGDYCFLRKEREHVVIGIKKKILENQRFKRSTFQPNETLVQREFPMFFLVTMGKNKTELEQMFLRNEFPILRVEKFSRKGPYGIIISDTTPMTELTVDTSLEEVEEILKEFVHYNFGYGVTD